MHGRVVNVNKLRCIVEQRRIKACSAQGMPHFRGPIHAKNSNNSNNSKTTQNKLIETTYFNVPVHNFRTHIMQQSKFHIMVDVCDLSNGAISNDLERTLTLFSRSHHSLTLNVSQTATNTATVTIEGE